MALPLRGRQPLFCQVSWSEKLTRCRDCGAVWGTRQCALSLARCQRSIITEQAKRTRTKLQIRRHQNSDRERVLLFYVFLVLRCFSGWNWVKFPRKEYHGNTLDDLTSVNKGDKNKIVCNFRLNVWLLSASKWKGIQERLILSPVT